MKKKLVILGLIGSVVDAGHGPTRWDRWRPTIDLCRHAALPIDRFELLTQKKYDKLTHQLHEDITQCSPQTQVREHEVEFPDPWDFQTVYAALLDFARS